MITKKTKTKKERFVEQDTFETVKSVPGAIAQSFTSDFAKESVNSIWDQMLGGRKQKNETLNGGDLLEGQELNLAQLAEKRSEKKVWNVEPGIDYRREILHAGERTERERNQTVTQKIQEILFELRVLISKSQELQITYKQIVVEQIPAKIGTYHENFFSWLLNFVKHARMRIEDATSWLAMFKSKKKQKQYWNMFKKHGTTFGLSNERVLASQTG